MGLFSNKEEVVLCSPMEGTITFNGEPLKGAKLERLIKWEDEVGEKDYVTTDDKGFFSFPVRKQEVSLSTISQFVVAQEIRVMYQGDEYPIWAKAKREKGLFGELGGMPIGLLCEITDELVLVDQGRGTLLTACKWTSIEELKE